MPYKVKRFIHQYSLVDLLEILQYPEHPEYVEVRTECLIRNPSDKELQIAQKGLAIRNKVRQEPLSFIDILFCILTPFVGPKTEFTRNRDVEESYDDQITEFENRNESRKARQLQRCKSIIEIVYGFIGFLIIILFLYFLFQS